MTLTNSHYFFNAAFDYQTRRAEILSEYDAGIAGLDDIQGSPRYGAELERLAGERDSKLATAKADRGNAMLDALRLMREANAKRPPEVPTETELRLLTALKMREGTTQRELDAAARGVKTSIGQGILQEVQECFSQLCGLSGDQLSAFLRAVDGDA